MPTKGNPRHAFRFEEDLWEAFCAAMGLDPLGRNQSQIVRDLVAWYSHWPGAPKPQRPTKQAVSEATTNSQPE